MKNEEVKIKKKFRPEIEGLRAVAAILVAIYHIWFGRVSGGVDVFFVVSGFLITTSLLSKVRRTGTVNFFDFIFGLLKRLLPSAFFVLYTVIIFSYIFIDQSQWVQIIKEVFASSFYYENWQLALSATDYLDQSNEKSPVQHFWAMSIQGQFYLIWFLIFTFAIKFFNKNIRKTLAVFFTLLLIVSFAYSVYLTQVNQPWAYFDTRTRVWEFAMGALLCLTITKIKLPKILAAIGGWLGLIMLVLCGVLFEVSTMFPGYIALVPTLAAVLILVSGENESGKGAEKFLGHPIMVKLGALSYGFYLWHWVILTFYKEIYNIKQVSLLHGILIIVLSAFLSWVVTLLVEKPIRNLKVNHQSFKMFAILLIILLPVVLTNGLWKYKIETDSNKSEVLIGSDDYPGARVFDMKKVDKKPYLPTAANISDDKALPFTDGCQQNLDSAEVKICEYGATKNYDATVALVGGSHSTHWHSALLKIAEKHNIRLVNMTKAGCRLSTGKEGLPKCDEWNEHIIGKIAEVKPDLVFTTAEISYFNIKEVPQGYIEQFEALNKLGIQVFGVRDTPYFRNHVPRCIEEFGRDSKECAIEKVLVVPDVTDWSKLKNPPANVHYYDYTDHICPDTLCRPVIGNVVGYYDTGHLSVSFVNTLVPYIEEDLIPLLNKVKKK